MKTIKTFEVFNVSAQSKIPFTKQTMKLDVNWRAAKDFEVYYYYKWMTDHNISNDENGCNFASRDGRDSQLADTSKLNFLGKPEIDDINTCAQRSGGSPKPAFIVKKGIKLNVKVKEFNDLIIEIIDGEHAGKKFTAQLAAFRTCLIGESKNENLIVSKYRIFLNGKPLKTKYYINMGRIKLALINAFGFSGPDVPYYIEDSSSTTLDRNDCKNVQIMQYDNNSKIGVPVDFDILAYYDDYVEKMELKKNMKKYNL